MFKNVTIELSLKPFKSTDEDYMRGVLKHLFKQWSILCDDAEEVSVLLWTADGSEILDWHGNLDEKFEWCKYVGGANNRRGDTSSLDPKGVGLHTRSYLYMDNPPEFTYAILKKLVSLIKVVGAEMLVGKRIRVGETFDSGPEFAKSDFKYNRHNECCAGESMGKKSMVCCYSELNGDDVSYAGFPNGIPDKTPFGTFFGRQCQEFLTSMGFDYLWLSNGFGFGMETWKTTGAVFDGKNFDVSRFDEIKEKILGFWHLFRKECPDFRVETRGTNLSVGIDLATDGVPLRDIYNGNFNFLPPPNSPWAPLNGNFGLEIGGYMSRISELPKNESYLFRYYVHDPWWANTPWTDRYDSLPHDIYLPMMVCRLDENGDVQLPENLNILSADNSFGEMPDFCAYEPSVYIKKAERYAPDEPSPVIWVYPFDEYHEKNDEESIREMFFGDWFICEAINHGFPLSSVVSTANFIKGREKNSGLYNGNIIVSVVPDAGSAYEKYVLDFVKNGGKAIFYGSVKNAGREFLDIAGIKLLGDELYGEMMIDAETLDTVNSGKVPEIITHRRITCGGGIATDISGNHVKPLVSIGGRVCGTYGKNIVWLRGTCSADFLEGKSLITPDDAQKYFIGETLMRLALDKLGIHIAFEKEIVNAREPVIMISRHDNAYMFAICSKNTTTKTAIKLPCGAPVFVGGETKILPDGSAQYYFTQAELRECRVFIEQKGGIVSCHEITPASFFANRRLKITGLENATVRIFGPMYTANNLKVTVNPLDDEFGYVGDDFKSEYITDDSGTYIEVRNVTGTLMVRIPREKIPSSDFDAEE